MEVIGAVLVFLLGACAGLLLGLYLVISRFIRSTEEQIAAAQERAEQHAGERRAHLDATAAIVMERMRLVGAALAAQLRETAAEQHNDLRLAVGLPAVEVPGRRAPRRAAPSVPTAPHTSPRTAASSRATPATLAAATPATSSTTRAALGVWTLGDDELTPPSGWTPEEVRERAQQSAERAP